MKNKKVNFLFCRYKPKEDRWRCKLNNVKKEFSEIDFGEPKYVEIHPLAGGGTAILTSDNYCAITKKSEEGNLHLWCDSDEWELEKRLHEIMGYGTRKVEIK